MLPTDDKHKSKKRRKNGDNPNAQSVLVLQVSLSRPKELPVETTSDMVMVTGLVNRCLLSQEILDFCGVKRYTLEPTHDSNSGTASKRLDL